MKELLVIKIGGNIIDDEKKLGVFLRKFNAISGLKILVHGGGKLATDLSKKLGVEANLIEGKRVTDAETLKIVVMVYSAINKAIVAQLNAMGCNAIGVCGADMNMIPAKKREKGNVDFGFVGDVLKDSIPLKKWEALLDQEICPVIGPITADASGQLLNTNADTIASAIAQVLSKTYKVKLIYCFEKGGVLKNPEDEKSVIPLINGQEYIELKEQGIVSKGMIPKLDNAWGAMKNGVNSVIIGNAMQIEQLASSPCTEGTQLSLTQ